MPYFSYKGRTSSGELITGKIDSPSPNQAIEELTRKGIFILSLEEEKHAQMLTPHFRRKELAQFCIRLGELIKAGLPLLRALNILQRQFARGRLGGVISEIYAQVRDGASLSQVLSAYPNLPPILPALISSGERSGNLDYALKEAGDVFNHELELRSKVKSALFYPALVLTAGTLTIFFLLSFVIPRVSEIFVDLGQRLPLITRIVLFFSHIFSRLWWLIILLVIGGYWGFKKFVSQGPARVMWERFKLRIPVINKLILYREYVLFPRTLGMLIRSGVPVVEAVELARSVLSLESLKIPLAEVTRALKEGESLSKSLEGIFPEDIVDVIAVGEESGNLENSLLTVADNYAQELDYRLKIGTQLLEPLLILFVGMIVGVIVIAMLLPIFELNMLIR
ncbi:MAG: hypothetical protein B6D53_04700 [Candidatus Omnitrophica bacterium 4484_49]|nr:type II secretion system F family protein [Candidatus Omnitrophota bacterium]OQX82386.1 MAG: hypothetical protein B6D53_04700 [Candidatus Omnitrophica bacterium 4484_49]